jgi:hypothetical protein
VWLTRERSDRSGFFADGYTKAWGKRDAMASLQKLPAVTHFEIACVTSSCEAVTLREDGSAGCERKAVLVAQMVNVEVWDTIASGRNGRPTVRVKG